MKRILSILTLLLCFAFTAANAQDNYNATTMGEKVYLETASWGQNSPFNKQIFTSYGGSTNAKAGCVPTAYAIVMRYHEFPTEGTAKTLYNCQAPTYVEITDRVYDFSKMPLTNGSGWTEEQQTEVAKFFSHVLHACFPSSIGTGATTVNEGQTSKVLNDYFNYQLINASYQANFTMEQWAEKLRESIDNGCPVPYAANNSGTGDTRHMFVVDGYTANGYFHFNFGWNGSGNGWFKLDNITPSQGDNYSWNGNSQHYALFNLAPNKTPRTVTATTNSSSMGTVSINGGTAGNSVSVEVIEGTKATLTAHPAEGYVLASWTKNGDVVGTKNPIQVSVGESDNDYVANFDEASNVVVVKDYIINPDNGLLNTTGKSSVWTSKDTQPTLTLKATNANGAAVNAISALTSSYKFYATAYDSNDKAHTSITYTLSVPEGYVIKEYIMTYVVGTANQITLNGSLLSSTGTFDLFAAPNAQTASFTTSVSSVGQQYITVKSIKVTVQSEGGEGTPTPDPEPEPDPTPVTYTISTTANPANGGTAKFAVGTGSQKTQGDVENGTQITLYATANTGYTFVNWTLNGTAVSTSATCNVSVSQAANYVANFQEVAVEPEQPGEGATDPLAGKNFRLKEKTTGTYMNIYDNATHSTGAKGGVNVAALNESSDGQIFQFIENGNGYNLKSATGYYINCQAWNVDANSTTSGAVLTLESTANKLEYLIKCNKGYFKIGAVDGNANIGKFVYCNESEKANASVWVLEEVVETPQPEEPQEQFPDGAYKVYWQADNRGYLAYHATDYPDEAKLADVAYNGCQNLHYNSSTDNVDLVWYLITANNGKRYLFQAATGKFLGVNTGVNDNGIANKLSTTEAWPIAIEENTNSTRLGHYIITTVINGTNNLLCSGCGTNKTGHPVRWLVVNDANQKDGGAPLQLVKVDNVTVADNVMNKVLAVINSNGVVPFKVEIANWRNDNPNTHLGSATIGSTSIKLTPEHLTQSNIEATLVDGSTLAFTRKYRGFEFQGFYIGETSLGTNPTLKAENIAAVNETTPLVAKFTATDDVTLFYDDDQYSYRIPAIAKTGTNRLVAISDYRHNLDDIGRDNHGTGTKRIDLVMRTSDDNGATWSETRTIAAGDNSKVGSYLRAFGDAAVAAVGNNIVVMAAAGDVLYTSGTTSSPNKMARIFSSDNGATWSIEEMTTKMYSTATSLIPSGGSAFFGSGKLAVDENFNGTGKARIYGALLVRIGTDGYNNFGIFSDDLGATWKILGGDNTNPVAKGDEPKVEILPNGQILLSARRGGGRVFRVFTYGDDKANGSGSWEGNATNGCDNGGSNATNGEIICLDAKRPNGEATKILLQSQPKGGSGQYERYNVTIWYKEVSANETYTSSSIASGWTQGLEVCPAGVKSAYSAMCLQENGEIAFFFEEAPCYGDDHTKGYSMVYVPLTIEEITKNQYFAPNAELPDLAAVKVVLTDINGNEFYETVEGATTAEAVATALKNKYSYITLGENGTLTLDGGTYIYTNSVTLPFKVSNDKQDIWHNIYWPANTEENGYPVYLSAASATDTYVPKVTEANAYGSSSYNTLNNSDKINWAIYSVDNGFTFTLKNKLTGKYIQATGVASGNAQNVKYVEEEDDATAFEIIPDAGSYKGDYALKATINNAVGYLCSTSATGYHYATHYNGNRHPGAWLKFEEPDYEGIIAEINDALASVDNGIYTLASGKQTTYNTIKSAMENSAAVKLNILKGYLTEIATLFDGATLNVPTSRKYYRFKAYNNRNAYMVSNGISQRMTVNTNPDNAASIFYINEDNQPINYKYGVGVKDTYDSGAVTSPKETFTFSVNGNGFIIKTNTKTVNNNNNGEYVYHHAIENNAQTANVNRNSSAAGDRTTWLVEAVASLPVTISITGYATLYAPVALEVPTGVTAYTVTIDGEWAVLNKVDSVIPANTGVVLQGNPDTYYFVITTTDNSATSALEGSVAAEYITKDAYVLTADDTSETGVCFGKATKNQENGDSWLNNSHKAYLPMPAGSEGISFYGFRYGDEEDNTTAVENVEIVNENVIYDLSGRRISEITEKGIYIVNGKKIFVK